MDEGKDARKPGRNQYYNKRISTRTRKEAHDAFPIFEANFVFLQVAEKLIKIPVGMPPDYIVETDIIHLKSSNNSERESIEVYYIRTNPTSWGKKVLKLRTSESKEIYFLLLTKYS